MFGKKFLLWTPACAAAAGIGLGAWLGGIQKARAAVIDFLPAVTMSSDNDVLGLGISHFAYNYNGTATVNGVTFTGLSIASGAGNFQMSLAGAVWFNGYYQSGPFADALSSGYQNFVRAGVYSDGTAVLNATITGLALNRAYAVQVWASDSRNNPTQLMHRLDVVSGGGTTATLDFNAQNVGGGVGQFTTGGFVANATTQTFSIQGTTTDTGPSTQLNAIQVRDVTGIWSGAVNGSWDSATANWSGGQALSTIPAGVSLLFADKDGLGRTVTNSSVTVPAGGVVFNGTAHFSSNTVAYTLGSGGGGGWSGLGSLRKSGASTLTISGTQTFTGGITLSGGSIRTTAAAVLPTGALSVASGSRLELGGFPQTLGQVTNSGVINSSTAVNLAAVAYSGTGTISNVSLVGAPDLTVSTGPGAMTFAGALSFPGSLFTRADGAGVLTLSGAVRPAGDVVNRGSGGGSPLAPTASNSPNILGSGAVVLAGTLGSAVTRLVQESPTSPLILNASNPTFTAPIEVRSGTVVVASPNMNLFYDSTANSIAGTGPIFLGTGTANTAFVYSGRAGGGEGGNYSLSNPLTVSGSGTNIFGNIDYSMSHSGSITLDGGNLVLTNTNPNQIWGVFQTLRLTGGVSGTGSLWVTNSSGSGNTKVVFDAKPVNNEGGITFNNAALLGGQSGTGNAVNSIEGGVGPAVREITQASNFNALTIGTGSIAVNPEGLSINANGTAGVTLSGPITGSGVLTLRINNTGGITISGALNNTGGLVIHRAGSGALSLPATLNVPLSLSGSLSSAFSVTSGLGANATLIQNNNPSANWTLSGAMTVGAGGKRISSIGGQLTVTGAFSGTGPVTLSLGEAGYLSVTGALSHSGSLINSGEGVFNGSFNSTSTAAPGAVLIDTVLGASVTRVVQDNPGAEMVLSRASTSLSAPVEIRRGALVVANQTGVSNASILGSGAVYLGTGSDDTALVYAGRYFGVPPSSPSSTILTIPNRVFIGGSGRAVIAASDYGPIFSGTLTLGNNLTIASANSGGSALEFSGGVDGAGDIEAVNASGASSGSYFRFTTKQVNHAGSLVFRNGSVFGGVAGTGSGLNEITGGIGVNVEAVVQGSSSNPLQISSGSIRVNPSGLRMAMNSSATLTSTSPVTGSGTLVLEANSSSVMRLSGAMTLTGTLVNAGSGDAGSFYTSGATGPASVVISTPLGASLSRVIQDAPRSALVLNATNAAFSGPVEVRRGYLVLSNSNNAFNNQLGTGPVTLGASSGTAAIIVGGRYGLANSIGGDGGDVFASNPITVSGGGTNILAATDYGLTLSGTLTLGGDAVLAVANANGSGLVFNGGVNGVGNLIVSHVSGSSPSSFVRFDLKEVNPLGTITFGNTPVLGGVASTSASSISEIKGGVGPNVSAIIQNSGVNPVTVSGGTVRVGAGGLAITSRGAAKITVSAPTSGPGAITLNVMHNTGAVELTGVLNHTGGVIVNQFGSGPTNIPNFGSVIGPVVYGGTYGSAAGFSTAFGSSVTGFWQTSPSSGMTLSGAMTVGSAGKTYAVNSAAELKITGSIAGTGDVNLQANSTGALTVSGALTFTGSITNTGSGNAGGFYSTAGAKPGSVIVNSALGSTITRLIQDSPTSPLVLNGNNTTFNGPVEIRSGPLVAAYNSGKILGNGTIYLGTGSADASLIYAGRYGAMGAGSVGADGTLSNPIVVGGSGLNVIAASDYSLNLGGTLTLASDLTVATTNAYTSYITMTGGVVGAGTLSLVNSSSIGVGYFNLTNKPLNHSGNIVFSNGSVLGGTAGIANVTHYISGGIGSNVRSLQLTGRDGLSVTSGSLTVGSLGLSILSTGSGVIGLGAPITGPGQLDLAVGGSGSITLSSVFSNAGGLRITRSGNGSVTFSGTASLSTLPGILRLGGSSTAPLNITTGVGASVSELVQESDSAAISISSGAVVAGASGKTLTSNASASLGVSSAVNGAGTLWVRPNAEGVISLSGGMSQSGWLVNAGAGSGTVTVSGVVSSPVAGIWQNSPGARMVLTGANTLSGTVRVSAGTLVAAGSGALGSGLLVLEPGGLLDLQNAAFKLAQPLSASGGLVKTSVGTSVFSGSVNLGSGGLGLQVDGPAVVVSGTVSGAGGFVKSGTGAMILSGSNAFAGGISVVQGSVGVAYSGAAGVGAVDIGDGAVFSVGVPQSLRSSGLMHRWSFDDVGGTVIRDSVGGASGSIVNPGGSQNATLNGGSLKMGGGAWGTASYANLPTSTFRNLNEVTFEIWSSIDALSNWARIVDLGDGYTTSSSFLAAYLEGSDLASPILGLANFGENARPASPIAATNLGQLYHWTIVWSASQSVIRLYRDGVLVVSRSNYGQSFSYVPASIFWLGRSHYTGDPTANATYTEVRVWGRALDAATIAASTQAGPDAIVYPDWTGGAPEVLANSISGAGSLQKASPSQVLLSGVNSHAGGTRVTAGTLAVAQQSALGTGSISVAAGATVRLEGNTDWVASSSFNGAGSLVKAGSSAVTLSGINALSGSVRVTQGTLRVTSAAQLGSASVAVDPSAVLVFDINSDITLPNTITGPVMVLNYPFRVTWNGGEAGGPPSELTSAPSVVASTWVPFSYQITASNNPYAIAVSGLPAGLTYNSATRTISGTVTAAGTAQVQIAISNSGGIRNASLQIEARRVPRILSMKFADDLNLESLDSVTPKGPLKTVIWNVSGGASGARSGLLDHQGYGSPVGVSWSSNNTWRGNSSTATQNGRIVRGYLDDSPNSITVTGIPYASYNVYGIIASDSNLTPYQTQDFLVNGTWVFGGASAQTAPGFGSWEAAGQQWIPIDKVTGQRGNFWRVSGQSASTLTIQGRQGSVPDVTTIPTQSNMTSYASGNIGRVYRMTVTGATGGGVWGTDYYTDDSSISTAAVHAGVVSAGQTKDVYIRISAGLSSYTGSTRNGVTTSGYGPWSTSYEFVAQPSEISRGSLAAIIIEGDPDQSITFPPLALEDVSLDGNLVLQATASSGLPVSYSVLSGSATVSGNVLSFTGMGNVVVEAVQVGNGTIAAAAPVARSFYYNRLGQTITFTAPSTKTYGDAPFAVSASATSGLPVTLSVVSGPGSISGNTVTLTGAGSLVLRANQPGSTQYMGVSAQYTISVSPLPASVVGLAVANKVYDGGTQAAWSGTPALSGIRAGDTVLLEGTLAAQFESAAAGNSKLVLFSGGSLSGASAGGYSLVVPQGLRATISPKAVSINGLSVLSKTYDGLLNAALSGVPELVGVLPGDPVALGGTPVAQFADALVGVSKPVTVSGFVLSGAAASNYALVQPAGLTGLVTRAPQSVNFGVLAGRRYLDAPFALNATATSALPVSFQVVSGPAVISAGSLAVNGVGTVVVRAEQEGNALFEPALAVERSFAVDKALQTTSFVLPAAARYGDAPLPLGATASSGLPVGYSIVSGPGVLTAGSVGLTGVGTVVVRAEQAGDGLYEAAPPVERTLVVGKSLQTILALDTPVWVRFGSAPVLLGGSASSGLPVVFSVVTGPGSVVGGSLTVSGVGQVQVRAEQAGSALYESAPPLTRTVQVERSLQSIEFGSLASLRYAQPAVPLVASASSGLPVVFTVVSGPAVVEGGSLRTTGVGTVVVRASQGGSALYEASDSVDRTVVIDRSLQTVTFNPPAVVAPGNAPVALLGTATSDLPVSFSVASGSASVVAGSLVAAGAGQVWVVAEQAGNALYEPASAVERMIEVARAAQSIEFALPAVSVFGSTPLPLVAGASSGLPVNFDVVSGPGQITGGSLVLLAGGEVTVRASQAGSALFLAAAPVDRKVNVARASQSIQFELPAMRLFGDAPVPLAAVASSTLPVAYSVVSGPGTVVAGSLVLGGVGEITVRAEQEGSPQYEPAPAVIRSVSVGKGLQTLNFDLPQTMRYTDPALLLQASSSVGLTPAFEVVSGPGSIVAGSLVVGGVGPVVVRATQGGSGLYEPAAALERVLTVTRGVQIIGFEAPVSVMPGNAAVPLFAGASSGLPVEFSVVQGPASLVGGSLVATSSGTVVVQADQSGSVLFLPAESVQRSITVLKHPQSVNFELPANKTYLDAPVPLAGTASSGLGVEFSVASGPARIEAGSLVLDAGGVVVVRASQSGSALFDPSEPVERSLTVARAAQSIGFVLPEGRIYGEPPLILGGSATSGLPLNFSVVSGPARIDAGSLLISGVGPVVVRAEQGGSAQYEAAPAVNQTIAVVRASQSLEFELPASWRYASGPLVLAGTSSAGLAPSYSVVSGSAVVQAGSLVLTGVGPVEVRVDQAGTELFEPAPALTRTLTAVRGEQRIDFSLPSARRYTDGPLLLAGTSSVGLPLSFEVVSGPARLQGGSLVLSGAGPVLVRASQPGSVLFEPAISVDGTLGALKGIQTISFTAPAAGVYGGAPMPLSATASSGLSVGISVVSGPGLIAAGSLQLTGVGPVTLRASQPGSDLYEAANNEERTLSSAKASQTVTLPLPETVTFGAPAFRLNPASSSGLPVEVTVVSGPAQIAGGSLQFTGGGTVVVRAIQSGSDLYEASVPVERSIVVGRAPQTIEFAPLVSKRYGEGPVALSATASSGLPVEFVRVSGPGELVGGSLVIQGAGPVVVRAQQSGSDSYQEAPVVERTLLAQKATQSVALTVPGGKVFGDAPFVPESSSTSGLPVELSVVNGPARVVAGSLVIEGAGSLVVRASQSGSDLYEAATPVDATLEVQKRAASVTLPVFTRRGFDGKAVAVPTLTDPEGLPVELTYSGSTAVPVQTGSYALVASIRSPNYAGSAEGVLEIFEPDARFLQQPRAVQMLEGNPAVLEASAAGNYLQYKWYYIPEAGVRRALENGELYQGADTPALTVLKTSAQTLGAYELEITSGPLTVASRAAALTRFEPVQINRERYQAQAASLRPGARVRLAVSATGTAPLAYEWLRNGIAVASGTAALDVSTADIEAAGSLSAQYTVRVSNTAEFSGPGGPVGTASEETVVLSVKPLPVVGSLLNQGTLAGSSLLLPYSGAVKLGVSGTPGQDWTYQWRLNGAPISGQKASELSFALKTLEQEGVYDLVVTNDAGIKVSDAVEIKLSERPAKLVSPLESLTKLVGNKLEWNQFKVEGDGISYKWTRVRDGKVMEVQTDGVLRLDPLSEADAGEYEVEAFNGFSSVRSRAMLRVYRAATLVKDPVSEVVVNPAQSGVTLSVEAAGSELRYQWSRDGRLLPSGNAATLSLGAISLEDSGAVYSVRVFNVDPLSGREISGQESRPSTLRVRKPVGGVEVLASSAFVDLGAIVTLRAAATGAEPLNYQWFKDGVLISGATDPVLRFESTASSTGRYGVRVWNVVPQTDATRPVASADVPVTVRVPVTITRHPVGRTANSGSRLTLSVDADGMKPMRFQWRKNGLPITAATRQEYAIEDLQSAAEGDYDVVVENGVGKPVASNVATIIINDDVRFEPGYPRPVTVAAGSAAVMEVVIGAGDGVPRYQWRRDGVAIAGATGSKYRLRSAAAADAGLYDVVVTRGTVSIASPSAALTVVSPIRLAVPPVPQSDVVPQPGTSTGRAVLEVVAEGGQTLAYRWFRNGAELPGASEPRMEVEATDTAAAYSVEVRSLPVLEGIGAVRSAEVPVQLMSAVSISNAALPLDVSQDAGTAAALEVSASGGGILSYSWERFLSGKWEVLDSEKTARLERFPVVKADAGLYRVRVSNARNSVVSREAAVAVRVPNVILPEGQPQPQVVNPGDVAVFTVVAKGSGLKYQWRKDGQDIQGATASTYRALAVAGRTAAEDQADREGLYDVMVTHNLGVSLSNSVSLRVNQPPTIEQQPRPTALFPGAPFALSVRASGTAPFSYQWRRNGAAIENATASILSVGSATLADAGLYDVVVSNLVGSDVSVLVEVAAPNPVLITQQPLAQEVLAGRAVAFSVAATGSPKNGESALEYQWRLNGVPIEDGASVSGARTAQLRILSASAGSATEPSAEGVYDVVVSGAANSVASLGVPLTLLSAPVVEVAPQRQTVNAGDGAQFVVKARGSGPLRYQWRLNGSDIAGATNASLVLASVSRSQHLETYSVVVSNDYGSVQTDAAELRILPKLTLGSRTPSNSTAPAVLPAASASSESVLTREVALGQSTEFRYVYDPVEDFTLAFQWRRNGADLAGQTAAVLKLERVRAEDAGFYDLLVRALVDGVEKGRLVAAGEILKVKLPPSVAAIEPVDVRPGQRAVFAPLVSGQGAVTFEWGKRTASGVVPVSAVAGFGGQVNAASGALSFDPAREADSGTYEVRATRDGMVSEPVSAELRVRPPFTVELIPGGSELALDPRARLSLQALVAGASATSVPRFQWRFNGVNLAGANGQRLVIPAVNDRHTGEYDVLVTQDGDRVASAPLQVRVRPALQITRHPLARQTVKPGEPVELSVEVNNPGALRYQWYRGLGHSVRPIVGQTGAVLRIGSAAVSDGGDYMVVVSGLNSRLTSSIARVNVLKPVEFEAGGQPLSQSVALGGAVEFRVKVSGSAPITYQWLRDGAPVPGGTGAVLRLLGLRASDAGSYQVVVSNPVDQKLSEAAELRVSAPVVFVREPADLKVVEKGSLRLTADATGDGTLSWQWRRNGLDISGANGPELITAEVGLRDSGIYDVVVRNFTNEARPVEISSAVSRKASVQVIEPVKILIAPGSMSAGLGAAARFHVSALGSAPLTYRWSRISAGTETVLASTGDTLLIPSVALSDYGTYSVTVGGPSVSAADSSEANPAFTVPAFQLFEGGTLKIATQPQSVVTSEGGTVQLKAEVEPDAAGTPVVFRWYKQGAGDQLPASASVLDGTLTLSGVKVSDTGTYYAFAMRGDEWAQTLPATVIVNAEDPTRTPLTPDDLAEAKAQQTILANEGDNVFLRSYAVGVGLRVNWVRADGTPLPASARGADSAVLSLRGVTAADRGEYVAEVSVGNDSAKKRSVPWTLEVRSAPRVLESPESQARSPGTSALFSATVQATEDSKYQWYYRSSADLPWVPVPGVAGKNKYEIRAVAASDAGEYRLEVSNAAGVASSGIAVLEVYKPASIVRVTPQPPVADPGGRFALRVETDGKLGDEEPYQWFRKNPRTRRFDPIIGATSAELSWAAIQEADQGTYRVSVYGVVNGEVESPEISLAVNDPVGFAASQGLQVLTRLPAESAMFAAQAVGSDVQYQWYFRASVTAEWTRLEGANAAVLRLPEVRTNQDGFYGVRLSNRFSEAGASAAAAQEPRTVGRLIVQAPPQWLSTQAEVVGDVDASRPGVIRVGEGRALKLRLTVQPGSPGAVSYRWRKNGRLLSAGTQSAQPANRVVEGTLNEFPATVELMLDPVTMEDAGRYDLVVSNAYGTSYSDPLNVVVSPRPIITEQPEALTVGEGSAATFRVEALGDALTYQWYRGDSASGSYEKFRDPATGFFASGSVLSLTDVVAAGSASLSGSYFKVVVANALGSVESVPVRLLVASAEDLRITSQPVFEGLTQGVALPGKSNPVLRVGAQGIGSLAYQWRFNGKPIPGATSEVYPLPLTSNDSGGVYDVAITNGAIFVFSTPQTLRVDPFIQDLSIPRFIQTGDGVRMEAKVSSTRALSYHWYRRVSGGEPASLDGVQGITGARTPVLVIESASEADAGEYRLEITSDLVNTATPWKAVEFVTRPRIETQPGALALREGEDALFTVQAVGRGELSYRWMLNGVELVDGGRISGAASAALRIAGTRPADAGVYEVEVSNSAGSVSSIPVNLEVAAGFGTRILNPGVVAVDSVANLIAEVVGGSPGTVQWYRGSGESLREIRGETALQLRFNPVLATDAGVYTVEITKAGGAERVRASAELRVALEAASPASTPEPAAAPAADLARMSAAPAAEVAASVTVVQEAPSGPTATERQWWVYAVESVDAPVVEGGAVRRGFWVMEYIPQLDPLSGEVTGMGAGRSSWIWQGAAGVEEWAGSEVQAVVSGKESAGWILSGSRAGDAGASIELAGVVVPGSDSAWHGAPDALEGSYGSGVLRQVRLRWDSDNAALSRWIPETGWVDLLEQLRQKLPVEASRAGSGD